MLREDKCSGSFEIIFLHEIFADYRIFSSIRILIYPRERYLNIAYVFTYRVWLLCMVLIGVSYILSIFVDVYIGGIVTFYICQ